MDRWKSTARKKLGRGESQKGEDKRWRRSEMEKIRDGESQKREKMQVREKAGNLRNTVSFRCCVAPEGRTAAAGAETSGQMRMKLARPCGAKHILK